MNTKRFSFALALVALALLAIPAHAAETLDDVVRAYEAARGGVERWRSVRSLELSGRFQSFSQDEMFTARWARPGLYRFESVQQKRPLLYGRDVKGSWCQVGLYQHDWPRRVQGRDDTQIARDAELEPGLLDYRAKGHQAELAGRGEVDGEPTVMVKLTRADGLVETWHLDLETHLEVAVDSQVFDYTQTGDPVARRSYFSDFRRVDGIVLPFQVDAEYKARYTSLTVQSAKVDATFSEDLFRLPLSSGMEALRPLAGEWQVKLELKPDPRVPWQTVEFPSRIEARDDGALLEERYRYDDPFQGPVELVRQLSWDRYHEIYRFTHYDPLAAQIAVFEGRLDNGALVVSNETTNSAAKFGETTVLERYRSYEIGPDGWKTDGEVSTDGGKTWTLVAKFTYGKKKS